jgi:hypothetical protein
MESHFLGEVGAEPVAAEKVSEAAKKGSEHRDRGGG